MGCPWNFWIINSFIAIGVIGQDNELRSFVVYEVIQAWQGIMFYYITDRQYLYFNLAAVANAMRNGFKVMKGTNKNSASAMRGTSLIINNTNQILVVFYYNKHCYFDIQNLEQPCYSAI